MALSTDKQVLHRTPESILELGVSGSSTVYARGILEVVTDGNGDNTVLANGGSGVAAGVSVEGVDNSSGASSSKTCRLLGPGAEVALPYSGTIVYGDVLYASDDETVGNGADGPRLGTALEFHESLATTVWVKIDPTA